MGDPPPRPRSKALTAPPPAALATADRHRTEGGVQTAGVLAIIAGAVATVAAAPAAIPAFAVGASLLWAGSDATRLWRGRTAATQGVMIGSVSLLVAGVLGWPYTVATIALAGGMPFAAAHRLSRRDRRLLQRLEDAQRIRAPLEPIVERLIALPRIAVFAAAERLLAWERFDLVERIGTFALVPRHDALRQYYLATARLAHGDVDAARAIVRGADLRGVFGVEQERWLQLIARVRIATGEAQRVVDSFGRACAVDDPNLAMGRLLVLAAAHASIGDDAVARELVVEVAGRRGGRAALAVLAKHREAYARVAADVLAGESPYR